MRSVVVLPAPLGPNSPKQVRAGTIRSTPSTATRAPNFFDTSRASTIGLFIDCESLKRVVPEEFWPNKNLTYSSREFKNLKSLGVIVSACRLLGLPFALSQSKGSLEI